MAAIEFNWQPTDRQLRQFGFIGLVAFPLAGWLLLGRPAMADVAPSQARILQALLGLGVGCGAAATLYPRLLKPLFVLLSLLAFPIGFVVSEVIILAIYGLVFTPVALVFRMIGRDALQRNVDRSAPTYWTKKKQPAGPGSYFRQS